MRASNRLSLWNKTSEWPELVGIILQGPTSAATASSSLIGPVRAKPCSNHSGEKAEHKTGSRSSVHSTAASLSPVSSSGLAWAGPRLGVASILFQGRIRRQARAVGRLRMQWRLFLSLSLVQAAHTTRRMDQGGPCVSFRPPDDHFLRLAVAHASSFSTSFVSLVLADDAIAVTLRPFGLLVIRPGYPAARYLLLKKVAEKEKKAGPFGHLLHTTHESKTAANRKEKKISQGDIGISCITDLRFFLYAHFNNHTR